jgi:phosphoglycolate phosphatase
MIKTKKTKVIIFDLDGVLINSLKNMNLAINQVNKEMKLNISFAKYKIFLGLPFEIIMKKIGIQKNIENIKKNYQKHSNKNLAQIFIKKKLLLNLNKLSKVYKIAVFTSKDRVRSNKILKKYKIFDYIVSSDDVKKGKPNPEGLIKIKRKFKVNSSQCIFIGDSIYDYKASKIAKIPYVHAAWGYGNMKNFKKITIIKKFDDILKVIALKKFYKLPFKST